MKKNKKIELLLKNNFCRLTSYFIVIFMLFYLQSCITESKIDASRFKKGVFEIPAGNDYGKTTIIRTDSLQIEKYYKRVLISNDSASYEKQEVHIDTLYIKWKNNFFYTLKMKSPKNDLDKDPIFVQINTITDSSYSFTAKIGYSNFKQNGSVFIPKN